MKKNNSVVQQNPCEIVKKTSQENLRATDWRNLGFTRIALPLGLLLYKVLLTCWQGASESLIRRLATFISSSTTYVGQPLTVSLKCAFIANITHTTSDAIGKVLNFLSRTRHLVIIISEIHFLSSEISILTFIKFAVGFLLNSSYVVWFYPNYYYF